jgi:hypothetical protein
MLTNKLMFLFLFMFMVMLHLYVDVYMQIYMTHHLLLIRESEDRFASEPVGTGTVGTGTIGTASKAASNFNQQLYFLLVD